MSDEIVEYDRVDDVKRKLNREKMDVESIRVMTQTDFWLRRVLDFTHSS